MTDVKAAPAVSAAELMPAHPTLPRVREAAADCHACDLWTSGTQTVFGEGPSTARLMFVGEQPGDLEDREGAPFVGPSGRLLDAALEHAGIDRADVYVTNAVKHFKWVRGARGQRRIHKKPNGTEIRACRPWLEAEIALVHPRVIVCLGATAAQSLLGTAFRVTRDRGKPFSSELGPTVIATVHPSAVLRSPTPDARARAEREFMADVEAVARYLERDGSA
jgi:DNA polymerase